MPTFEERLTLVEHEQAELKKTIELQTIAIGTLVNKAALERLTELLTQILARLPEKP